jgi:hypothetical protein
MFGQRLVSRQHAEPTMTPLLRALTVNRRSTPRNRILQRCLVRPVEPAGTTWLSIAYDISAGGIALTLPCPLAVGAVLEIHPWGLPGARPLQARVVRINPVEFLWFAGCELSGPLGGDELRTWLTAPRAASSGVRPQS